MECKGIGRMVRGGKQTRALHEGFCKIEREKTKPPDKDDWCSSFLSTCKRGRIWLVSVVGASSTVCKNIHQHFLTTGRLLGVQAQCVHQGKKLLTFGTLDTSRDAESGGGVEKAREVIWEIWEEGRKK